MRCPKRHLTFRQDRLEERALAGAGDFARRSSAGSPVFSVLPQGCAESGRSAESAVVPAGVRGQGGRLPRAPWAELRVLRAVGLREPVNPCGLGPHPCRFPTPGRARDVPAPRPVPDGPAGPPRGQGRAAPTAGAGAGRAPGPSSPPGRACLRTGLAPGPNSLPNRLTSAPAAPPAPPTRPGRGSSGRLGEGVPLERLAPTPASGRHRSSVLPPCFHWARISPPGLRHVCSGVDVDVPPARSGAHRGRSRLGGRAGGLSGRASAARTGRRSTALPRPRRPRGRSTVRRPHRRPAGAIPHRGARVDGASGDGGRSPPVVTAPMVLLSLAPCC